jgi:tetratricopeptide (TPR) repeat protein
VRSTDLIGPLLVSLTLAVFFPILSHGFVSYDDFEDVVWHPQVRPGLTLESVGAAFSTPYRSTWHPLTVISLQIDREIWGEGAGGYHLTNLLLHQTSVLLLFFALSRMTGSAWRSAFVAGVFAIHPLHVESVAWAVERKDVLSGLFWMLTLYAYAGYAERPGPARYLGVLLGLALGLLAKPMLVTLPLVLLLLDYWPLRRLRRWASPTAANSRFLGRPVLEKLPMLALVAAVCAITVAAQRAGGSMGLLPGLTLPLRLANAVHAYGAYLANSLWPAGLAVFYPHPISALPMGEVAASGLVLAVVSAAVVLRARAQPAGLVGWLWYLGTLVPVIGIVQVGLQARADRYMYLPLIGLSILVAWVSADLLGRRRIGRLALGVAGTAALGALAICAATQVSHWRSSVALFEHALAVTEGNHVAHAHLAGAMLKQGRIDRAEFHAREAVRLGPGFVGNQMALAKVSERRGDLDGLIRSYRAMLEIDPDLDGVETIHHELGFALIRVGHYAAARPHLERVLASNPELPHVIVGLALVAEKAGRREAAVRRYQEALSGTPGMRFAANNLTRILAACDDERTCDPEQAVRIAEAAVRALGRPDVVLLNALAAAYRAAGRPADAERAAVRAVLAAEASGESADARSYTLDQLFRDLGVTFTFEAAAAP